MEKAVDTHPKDTENLFWKCTKQALYFLANKLEFVKVVFSPN